MKKEYKKAFYSSVAKLLIATLLLPLIFFANGMSIKSLAAPTASGNDVQSGKIRWQQMVGIGEGQYTPGSNMTVSANYGGAGGPRYSSDTSDAALWIYHNYYGEGEDLIYFTWDYYDFEFSQGDDDVCLLSFDNSLFGYVSITATNRPYGDPNFYNVIDSAVATETKINSNNYVELHFRSRSRGTIYGFYKASRVENFAWHAMTPTEGGYTPGSLQPLDLIYEGNGHPAYNTNYGPATWINYEQYFDENTDLLCLVIDDVTRKQSTEENQLEIRLENVFGHKTIQYYSGDENLPGPEPSARNIQNSVDDSWVYLKVYPYVDGRNYIYYKMARKVPVTGIFMATDEIELEVGDKQQMSAVVLPRNATNRMVNWTTTNEYIARVSRNGLITGCHPGVATITAKTVEGGYTASCNVTVKCDSPIPSTTCTPEGILLEWDDMGTQNYRVYRYTGNSKWIQCVDVWGTSYLDKNVDLGTEYSYFIQCLDEETDDPVSDYDENRKAYVVYYPLQAPQLTLIQVPGGVNISWEAQQGAVKYRIYRRTANGQWASLKYSTGTSAKDTTVEYGTEYYYGIRCMDANGKYLNELVEGGEIVYQNLTPELTLEQVSGGIKVSWEAIDGAVKYRIYRKEKGGQWASLKYTTGLSIKDTAVNSGTEYVYGVRCIDGNGKYINDLEEGGSIVYQNLTPELTLQQVSGGIQVSWDAVDGAVKYRVYRKEKGGQWASLKYTTGLSIKDTAVNSGTEYVYGVRCIDSNGKYMNELEEGGSIVYVNNTPQLTLTRVIGGIQISWDAVPGAVKYRIYKKEKGGQWASLKYTTSSSVKDTAVESGTEYVYGVRCIDAKGKYMNELEEGGSIIYVPKG